MTVCIRHNGQRDKEAINRLCISLVNTVDFQLKLTPITGSQKKKKIIWKELKKDLKVLAKR